VSAVSASPAAPGEVRRMLENPSLRNVVLLDGTDFAGLVDRGAVPAGARRGTRRPHAS
jgi:hypothetical protein